jgi:FG-GAP repeat
MTRHALRLAVLAGILTLAAGVAHPSPADAAGFVFTAFGAGAGDEPRVKVYALPGVLVADFLAFDQAFRGGVRVAVGDIDGDGLDDVVAAAGPGGGPHVKVFRGTCSVPLDVDHFCPGIPGVDTAIPLASFFAFPPAFLGGVFVAVGNFDLSNDATECPRHEIVVGADANGGPLVKVLRNDTVGGNCPVNSPVVINPDAPIANFFAFDPSFAGGVRVSAADLNNDGFADLVVGAGPGGSPHVKVFRNLSTDATAFGGLDTDHPVASFYAFDQAFAGGVYVGTAFFFDVFSSTPPVLKPHLTLGAGAGGGPRVVVIANTDPGTGFAYDPASPVASFYAFDPTFTGGARVGSFFSIFGPFLVTTPGPGGPAIGRTFVNIGGVATETLFSAAPFPLSTNGLFPNQ